MTSTFPRARLFPSYYYISYHHTSLKHSTATKHTVFRSPFARIHTSFPKSLHLSSHKAVARKTLVSTRTLFSDHTSSQNTVDRVEMADMKAVATEHAFSRSDPFSSACHHSTLHPPHSPLKTNQRIPLNFS